MRSVLPKDLPGTRQHQGGDLYRRRRLSALAGLAAASIVIAPLLTACGTGDDTGPSESAGDEFGVEEVAKVADLVADADKDKTIKNAVYTDYPPQDYLDEDGNLIGLQVDLMAAVAKISDLKIKNIETGAFDTIIPGLVSGRYDMASSFFGVTEERVAQVDFVTQMDVGTSFAVQDGSDVSIEAQDDLCGLSVAVTAGMTFIPLLESLSKDCETAGEDAIDVQIFPRQSDGVIAVENGRADAVAGSTDQIGYLAKQDREVQFESFVVEPVPQGVAFPKDSSLTDVIQAAFQELISDGTYAKILEKWGQEDLAWTDPGNVKINNTEPSS